MENLLYTSANAEIFFPLQRTSTEISVDEISIFSIYSIVVIIVFLRNYLYRTAILYHEEQLLKNVC